MQCEIMRKGAEKCSWKLSLQRVGIWISNYDWIFVENNTKVEHKSEIFLNNQTIIILE